ncbi:MAG: FIST C-terminal domain-containing protein [Nitrosomonadales bacterium]|nr:FIST C-terminal domain-containing protein [Nitrosomonadales bacterium]
MDGPAIEAVLAGWRAIHPGMGVCALLPETEKDSVAMLQEVCARQQVPLVGGIFPELVMDGTFRRRGVWLLCFAEMPYAELLENLPADPAGSERTAREIAARLRARLNHERNITLFMLFDAMVPNIGTLLDYLYLQLANRVNYAGANAGSETFQPMPCLFDNQRVVGNGMLLMLLHNHRGAILEHGYRAPDRNVYATATEGNRIAQIDWRPAFDVYRELVHNRYGVEITPENFYEYAVHFPFGIVRANHHVVVRIPVMLAGDGSLFCVGEVPANSVLTLLESPAVDSEETMRVLTEGLFSLNGGPVGAELLLFYCAGRRMHLGVDAATTELREFTRRTGARSTAGALSLGEIGGSTVHGYPLFHNATLVATVWY